MSDDVQRGASKTVALWILLNFFMVLDSGAPG